MSTTTHPSRNTSRHDDTVAAQLEPFLSALFAEPPPVELEFWDGSTYGRHLTGRLRLHNRDALRRIMWHPDQLGLARAFIAGDIDVEGNVAAVLRGLQRSAPGDPAILPRLLTEAPGVIRAAGGLGTPPPPPTHEMTPRGVRHSLTRDQRAISHHYDVSNEFYELVLGESMTYSCARFVTPDLELHEAQAAKHELIARKLGVDGAARLGRRPRLLDVGCGWGSLAIHAASTHDVDVVGITISTEQAAYARRRVADLGLGECVEIRVQDYREVDDGPFDAIASIGMAEHVGHRRMARYFEQLHRLLRPGGRLMNHAISSVGGSRLRRRDFTYRYVFPDGELLDVADTVRFMEQAGFEVRDVENLREHYAETLRRWVSNLERNWNDAVRLVGEERARVWLLYMSGSINGFDDAGVQLHQVLGVRLHDDGRSDMPSTRSGWG